MEVTTLVIIFLLGGVAGLIGALAGGAGLLTIPGLMFLGLPAPIAIATNKFASFGMSITAAISFRGIIRWRTCIPSTLVAMVGAWIGAKTLIAIPVEVVEKLVGLFLIMLLPLLLWKRFDKEDEVKKEISKGRQICGYFVFLAIGFWGSFFGGGFALFATYAYLFFFGYSLLECAGAKMIVALGIAVVSIAVYGFHGTINWAFGIVLLCGEVFGAFIGAKLALLKGSSWIRPAFVSVVLVSAVKFCI